VRRQDHSHWNTGILYIWAEKSRTEHSNPVWYIISFYLFTTEVNSAPKWILRHSPVLKPENITKYKSLLTTPTLVATIKPWQNLCNGQISNHFEFCIAGSSNTISLTTPPFTQSRKRTFSLEAAATWRTYDFDFPLFLSSSKRTDLKGIGPEFRYLRAIVNCITAFCCRETINRTEWSPIRSVIIRVITKSYDRTAGVRFVYHEYDYRPNWTTRSLLTN